MIELVTVDDLYSRPGFEAMIAEYAKLAIKKMPTPLYRKEDYLPLQAVGILSVWCTMYDNEVVGFASCLISKIPHYGVAVAIVESLFVMDSARHLGLGIRFMDKIERHARAAGVSAVFASCPIGSTFCKVLNHRNYSAETTTYVKVL